MRAYIHSCCLLLAAGWAPALAEAPFSFDAAPGRLPKDVVPLDYDLALVPDIAAHSLRGAETVTLKVRSATAQLNFNSLNQQLDHVLFDGQPVSAVSSDDQAQLSRVTLTEAVGVWAVRGQENDGATALANARQILADHNDYFGYPFPLPKLDSIATPGGFTGAMENWGAITYNDQILLVTAPSTIRDRQGVYSVQAHEMAHQWNGDLVTMGWWDDLWLGEAVLRMLEAYVGPLEFRNGIRAYMQAHASTDRLEFPRLPSGDRIALLDDQWALVQAGQQQLDRYLGLASAMGADRNDRAWGQIIDALGQLESYERGTSGHDAFTAYARSILSPLAAAQGWDARPGEAPPLQHLRRQVIRQLGERGDEEIVTEARRRFDAYLANPASLDPDDQAVVLAIVAANADLQGFESLHGLIRTARNETELDRYLRALMRVRDPILAQKAVDIALSQEIPPQADAVRLQLILGASDRNPALAWASFRDHVDQLMEAHPQYRPLLLAQVVPEYPWNAVPLDELEAWLKVRVPPEMASNLSRGMQAARFKHRKKTELVAAADAYLASRS